MRPLTLLAGIAGAQTVPSLINYQGRLSDSNGAALPTADYQLTFRIYDANTGGNLIWGPQIFDSVVGTNGHGLRIPVVQGYFNVMLGPTDVSNRDLAIAFNGTNRFVEVQVTNNTAISPRQWIVAAPYALNSLNLAGADWSAVFGTNDPVNGKISTTKLSTNVALRTGGNVLSGNQTITSGSLGIGSPSNPTESLLITGGNAFIVGANAGAPASSGALFFGPDSETRDGALLRTATGDMSFWRYNGFWNESMRLLKASGNVGIGKTNPATALDVNGTVTATSFSGSLNGASLTSNSVAWDRMALRDVAATNYQVGGLAISGSSGQFTSSAPLTPTLVSNLNLTIVTRGNPVEISFVADPSSTNSDSYFSANGGSTFIRLSLFRNGSAIGTEFGQPSGSGVSAVLLPPGSFKFLDVTQPGTNNYQVKISGSSSPVQVWNILMMAREL